MEYRVILTQNGEFKQNFLITKNKRTAFDKFKEIKRKSEKVLFEVQHVNTKKIFPVKHMLYIVKEYESTDIKRAIPDGNGSYIEEPLLFDKWFVMASEKYKKEEKFAIYGMDTRAERQPISGVMKILMKGLTDTKQNKQVIVVHNKLVIYNDQNFDMIFCKCIKDCKRLHDTLYKTAVAIKLKNLMFMGIASNASLYHINKTIIQWTGWDYNKVRRQTTRP
jgi:hypothetical protein